MYIDVDINNNVEIITGADIVTLTDVAERAGVALNTARRALADHPTVRPYIRDRVLKAAKEMDYHPNLLARALKDEALNLVPISTDDLENPYFGSLATQLSRQLVLADFEPALCFNAAHLMRMCRTLSTSGSILVNGFDEQAIRALSKRQKVVTIHSLLPSIRNVADVAIKFDETYRHLARLLVRRGCRRIATCSDDYIRALAHDWCDPKTMAVMEVLKEVGLSLVGPEGRPVFGRPQEVMSWMDRYPNSVDAIICGNDHEAVRMMYSLRMRGLKVPEDVRVVGCDANFLVPGLWSIKIETDVLARDAVGLLCRLLDGQSRIEPCVYRPVIVDDQRMLIE